MDLKTLKQQLDQAKADMQTHGRKAFLDCVQGFFVANPMAESVRWYQYTPYFNDGEPCEFTVGKVRLKILDSGTDWDICDAEELRRRADTNANRQDAAKHVWAIPADQLRILTQEENQLLLGFRELASSVESNEDLLEIVFGDHAKITVTREQVTIEEFDHD